MLAPQKKSYDKPAAAAAAKSLQSCPTLLDPIDGSPPGSPVPEILQSKVIFSPSSVSCPFIYMYKIQSSKMLHLWKDRFFFLFYSSGPDLNSIKWWGECHCTFLRQCLPFSQWSFPLIQAWYLCQLVLGTIMLCNKQSSNSEFSKIGLHSPIHGRRQWHPTPVLLPGKSHGQRSL